MTESEKQEFAKAASEILTHSMAAIVFNRMPKPKREAIKAVIIKEMSAYGDDFSPEFKEEVKKVVEDHIQSVNGSYDMEKHAEIKLKAARKEVDTLGRLTQSLILTSHPLRMAEGSLFLAKAWMGKTLGLLGVESPYKSDGKRESVEDIEPTDSKTPERDIQAMLDGSWRNWTHIRKVDYLREAINEEIAKIKNIELEPITNVYQHLSEARFWLGFELERVKTGELRGDE